MFHSGEAVPPTSDQSLFLITFQISAFRRPVLIGLAFQAKMIEAWLVLPACASGHGMATAHTEVREQQVVFDDASPRVLELQIHSGCVLLQPGPELQCRLRLEVAAATPASRRGRRGWERIGS